MIDILILAIFAIFILFRLYTVLGTRTGDEKDHFSAKESFSNKDLKTKVKKVLKRGNIIDVSFEQTEKDVKGGQEVLNMFKQKDRSFEVQGFLKGAHIAFETILTAFAKSDKKTLKNLLSPEVFELFEKDIETREKAHQNLEILLKDIKGEIMNARLTSKMMEIDVQFESEQTRTFTTRSSSENSPPRISQEVLICTDLWTFKKFIDSKDPNWILSGTHEAHISSS